MVGLLDLAREGNGYVSPALRRRERAMTTAALICSSKVLKFSESRLSSASSASTIRHYR